MMAYEDKSNFNNALPTDYYSEPSQIEGKLENNVVVGGLVSNWQPGFLEQFSNNCSNNNVQQQQVSFDSFGMQLSAQAIFDNMNATANQFHHCMQQPIPMVTIGFPQTTLMRSMFMQQPFGQASFQLQQQQQTHSNPNFITVDNDCHNALCASLEPNDIETMMQKQKSLFDDLEPLPVANIPAIKPIQSPSPPPSSNTFCVPRSLNKNKRLLPLNFQPEGNYILCGNRRKYFESEGNIRFRKVCKLFLQEYVRAPTKIEKSAVVTKVMNILQEGCPEGAFISPQGGRWYVVSERTAREKVGTYFRDCLSDSYKSSAKNKIARRKIVKKNSSNNSGSNDDFSDDGSLESFSFFDVDDLTPVPLEEGNFN